MDNQFEVVMTDTHQFEMKDLSFEIQSLKENEVLVKPRYVGICGSDLYLVHSKLKNLRLGHEWVGEVLKTGKSDSKYKVGSIVTGTGHFACGKCTYCLEERSNLCVSPIHFSSDKMGALRSSFVAPEDQLFPLNEELDSSLALIEVFAVGEQAYELVKRHLGYYQNLKILIFGAGPIGLAVAEVYRSYGLPFLVIEKSAFRVQNARSLGFETISFQEALLTTSLKNSFNLIVDCTNDYSGDLHGAFKWLTYFSQKEYLGLIVGKYVKPQVMSEAFNSKAAQLIWMRGVGNGVLKLTIEKWQTKLKDLKNHFISHEYEITDTQKAFEMYEKKDQSLKVIIKI